MVALIPARAGSQRVPHKNTRRLAGHPLLAYTLAAARQSGVFDEGVWVSSNDETALHIATDAGVHVMSCLAKPWLHTDRGRDIEWVRDALCVIRLTPARPDAFAILRPTSPFRTAETLQRAAAQFRRIGARGDSLRAMRRVREHPGKMWWRGAESGDRFSLDSVYPVCPHAHRDGTPWHSSPTQSLPAVYVQTSSLELAWTRVVDAGTIAGTCVWPFVCEGLDGFAIDTEADWAEAERIAAWRPDLLPRVDG